MPHEVAAKAAQLFNRVWDLLDLDVRSPVDDEQLERAALESRSLWREVGSPANHAISDWQVSRVYSVLGNGDSALAFAEMSLALCEANELGPFLTGFAHEAIARAHAVSGNAPLARRHIHLATINAGNLDDPDERQMLDDDLATVENIIHP